MIARRDDNIHLLLRVVGVGRSGRAGAKSLFEMDRSENKTGCPRFLACYICRQLFFELGRRRILSWGRYYPWGKSDFSLVGLFRFLWNNQLS